MTMTPMAGNPGVELMSPTLGLSMQQLDVLVVDDSATMRSLLRTILVGFGINEPRMARDGTAALSEMEQRPPSLIITDWEMAPMNGRDFLRNLRRAGREPLCFVPVIVITAHASRQLIQKAFESGATQLLVKPVTPAHLLQRIDWVLEDARPFRNVDGLYRQDMHLMHNRAEGLAPGNTKDPKRWMVE